MVSVGVVYVWSLASTLIRNASFRTRETTPLVSLSRTFERLTEGHCRNFGKGRNTACWPAVRLVSHFRSTADVDASLERTPSGISSRISGGLSVKPSRTS
jgi:hypothetical protein